MNYLPMLYKFSESDKKALIVLLILVILLIVIFGYLQKLVGWIMRNQGLHVDTMMYKILKTGVIKSKREFRREAYRKSMVYFVKKSWIPFVFILASVLALFIYGFATGDNTLEYYKQACKDLSIQFEWQFGQFFGLTIPNDWPQVVKWADFSFSVQKYYALGFTLLGCVSAVFYLVQVQAYLSRCLRIRQLCRTYFVKDLNKATDISK